MNKKTKIIIITIAAILAVAIAAFLIFFRPGTNDTTAQSSANSVTSSETVSTSQKVESTKENVKETVSKQTVDSDKTGLGIGDITTERGKTIRVPVSISNNPGIAASALKINYNGKKLTYIGYDKGEVFENYYFKEDTDSLLFSNIEDADSKKNGVMFYLKFKVKEDAVLGDTEISVDATDESFINFNEEFVKVGAGNAIVTIN